MKRMEERSKEVVQYAIVNIKSYGATDFDPKIIIYLAAVNFMTLYLVGKKYRSVTNNDIKYYKN